MFYRVRWFDCLCGVLLDMGIAHSVCVFLSNLEKPLGQRWGVGGN